MLKQRLPWVTWPALDRIKAWGDLTKKRVLEWGAGGSTLYWSDRGVAELASVEHDPAWVLQVSGALGRKQDHNVFLAAPKPGPAPGYESTVMPGFSFENYVMLPVQMALMPHIVLVDGRARPACLAVAAELALEAVILDNSERTWYSTAIRICGETLRTRGFGEPATYTGSGPYSPDSTWSTTIWERQIVT